GRRGSVTGTSSGAVGGADGDTQRTVAAVERWRRAMVRSVASVEAGRRGRVRAWRAQVLPASVLDRVRRPR
ncbi:MAG: hypothetical protein JWR42_1086, partial [Marmoricola sp.]|nr:hypothetical protein [Marmoricola sp.]